MAMRDSAATTGEAGSLTSVFDAEPSEWYEEVRQLGPVVWDEGLESWLVTSYDLVKLMALADHELWETPRAPSLEHPPFGMSREELVDFNLAASFIGFQRGPDYDRMHRWYFHAFSPRALARWGEALIEPIAHAQVDRLVADGAADLAADYAERVTPRVLMAIEGLPWDDAFLEQFAALRRPRVAVMNHQAGVVPPRELVERSLDGARQLRELVLPFVLERRSGEGDDFISMLWRDGESFFGGPFDELDVTATAVHTFSAGSNTTASVANAALYLLLTRDGLRDQVERGGEAALAAFAEEALRLYSSVSFAGRRATADVELGGTTIRKGEFVVARTGAANRDPEHYPEPQEVALDRRAPRDHFAFYQGPKICAGQGLARYQIQRIVSVALERLPADLRLDPDRPQPSFAGAMLRSWSPLHVLFTPPKESR
jgi:cytochrome P450